jgi:hypothetical protein
MPEIRWEFYPLVAQHELARTWLTMQRNLQLAPATIDAYGRNLNDYLVFCSKHSPVPKSSSPADREPPPAVYLACLPSAAVPRPRPLRCGLLFPEHGESRPRWRMS